MRIARRHRKRSPLLSWVLVSVAIVSIMPRSVLAKDERAGALPPSIERFLRWLPEDTETLFVAKNVALPITNPYSLENVTWQDIGLCLACGCLDLGGQKQFRDYRVRLIPSLKNVREIPSEGSELVIVAAANEVLHFRVFDGNGKRVADTNEKRLPALGHQIEEFRKRLVAMWPPHHLEDVENQWLIHEVASIIDQAPLEPLRGRKVEYVVYGAKNFDGVSSLGSLRSEGCAIIVFEKDLGDAAKEWANRLRHARTPFARWAAANASFCHLRPQWNLG